ncbi:glycosyltransferase involved in cell wall biosynthesis [Mumia flava]|uniref:Glycosyltransferase involved in cell wall biosynthesis n=1 Tax=Mumia flava TaxID=1348852 RepID=A0A0B2BQD9_9ACTN|nr:glycosyltransferase involved in cell wall biosynthesis [Mumia flava]
MLLCNWRDLRNPEGGGSERYVEQVARGLVRRGNDVTIFCAAHEHAPDDEVVDGVRYVRRGTKTGVYPHALARLLLRRFGRVDVVVDVQNGLPFFTRLVTRRPVVVLVHHVHREQWPVVYPGPIGRVGWWIESWLAPRLYRRSRYVAVSTATRDELVDLGVDADRIDIVHNGNDVADSDLPARSDSPRLCVVGRLVPHKRVEHAIDVVAALAPQIDGLHLDVVGDGWWHDNLVAYAAERGVADRVTFHGFVDDRTKNEIYGQAWVMLLPSLKEGWGIVIGEAGTHATPTIAYASAGGTRESIDHDVSGVLVDTEAELTEAARRLLTDTAERGRLGKGAREKCHAYTWEQTTRDFATVVTKSLVKS